jgi:hypothetical protein
MRCRFHVSVDMQVIERTPSRKHRSSNQANEDAELAGRLMAKCPVEGCRWVADVYSDIKMPLSIHNRYALGLPVERDAQRIR